MNGKLECARFQRRKGDGLTLFRLFPVPEQYNQTKPNLLYIRSCSARVYQSPLLVEIRCSIPIPYPTRSRYSLKARRWTRVCVCMCVVQHSIDRQKSNSFAIPHLRNSGTFSLGYLVRIGFGKGVSLYVVVPAQVFAKTRDPGIDKAKAVVVRYLDSDYQQKDGGGVKAKPFQPKISI